MIDCEEHGTNAGTCIECLNEVMRQRDDRWRSLDLAEARIRELAALLGECYDWACEWASRLSVDVANREEWLRFAQRVRVVVAEETPPSKGT